VYAPGERVPSNTWLISMIAEGGGGGVGGGSLVRKRVQLEGERVLRVGEVKGARVGEVAVGCRERF
jgi:hypothetical protein